MIQFITSVCCLTTALGSFSAHALESRDQLSSHQTSLIQTIGCIPTSTRFKADPNTAAGTFLYSYDKNGEVIVLLGKRSDNHTYCTFGGKSEISHKTVADTGAIETTEESIGVYSFHAQDLAHNPYIDFLDQDFLFRLYFRSVQYVDPNYLQSRLEDATDAKCKEYDHFVWEKVSTLINLLDSPSRTLPLFTPMVNILKTQAGQSFLKSLLKKQPLQKNKFRNLLFVKGSEKKVYPRTLSQKWNLLNEETGIWAKVIYKNHTPLLMVDSTDKDETAERVTIGRSTVAKMLANEQIRAKKYRLRHHSTPSKNWITISDLLLEKAGLSPYPSHSRGMNNPKNRKPTEKFFSSLLNTKELDPQQIASRMTDVLAYIHRMPQRASFFHASTSAYHHFVLTFTRIHQLLLGNNLSNNLSLRGTDLYFKDFPNDEKLYDTLMEKLSGDRGHILLCCNAAFTVGTIGSGDVSTSSLGLWLNDDSIRKLDFRDTFRSNATLLGLTSSYEPFESLLHQYRRQQSPNHQNGVMIAFQITDKLLKSAQFEYTFKSHGGLQPGENRWKKLQNSCQDFTTKKRNTLNSHDLVEFRFFMHPEIMRSRDLSMQAFELFPLSPLQERQFNQEMDRSMVTCLGQWLSMETMMIPGSLQGDIKLKKLYAYVQKHTFNHTVVERFPMEAVNSLIKFKATDGLIPLLNDPLNREKFLPTILTKAINKRAWDVIDVLLPYILEKKITTVLDHKQLGELLDQLGRKWTLLDSEKLLDVLDITSLSFDNRLKLSQLILRKSKNWIKTVKERDNHIFSTMDRLWQEYVVQNSPFNLAHHYSLRDLNKAITNTPQILATPYIDISSAPALMKEVWIETAISARCPQAALATITTPQDKNAYFNALLHGVTKHVNSYGWRVEEKFKITADYFNKKVKVRTFFDWAVKTFIQYPHGSHNSKTEILANLIPFGVDLTHKDETKTPRIFTLMALLKNKSSFGKCPLTTAILDQHNKKVSEEKPTPLTVTNTSGLNVVQHLQDQYLKGSPPHWLLERLANLGKESTETIRNLSLPLFLKIFDYPKKSLKSYDHKADYLWLKKLYGLIEQEASHDVIHEYVSKMPTRNLFHHLYGDLNENVLPGKEIYKIFKKHLKEDKENFDYPGEKLDKLWKLREQPSVDFKEVHVQLADLDYWISESTLNNFFYHTYIPILDELVAKYAQNPQEFWRSALITNSVLTHSDDGEFLRWVLSKVPSIEEFASDSWLNLHNFLLPKGRSFSQLYKEFPKLFTTQNIFCDRLRETFYIIRDNKYGQETMLQFLGDNLGFLTNPKNPFLFSLLMGAMYSDEELEFVFTLFKTYPLLFKTTYADGTTVKEKVENFKGSRYDQKQDPERYKGQMKRKKRLQEFLGQ